MMMAAFVKPTLDEVAAYCRDRRNRIDPEEFFYFYESKGWVVGRSPMKSWRAAVITWEKRQGRETNKGGRPNSRKTIEELRLEWSRDGGGECRAPTDEEMARLRGKKKQADTPSVGEVLFGK